MSNDFATDDCVDEGICLDSTGSAERGLKPKVAETAVIFALDLETHIVWVVKPSQHSLTWLH